MPSTEKCLLINGQKYASGKSSANAMIRIIEEDSFSKIL